MKRALLICGVCTLLGLVAAAVAWPSLPEAMPVHWNAAGEADGWGFMED
mgnify:CR=1 FL=1